MLKQVQHDRRNNMPQFQSFFIAANGDSSLCDELNSFMKSHVIIRTVENLVSTGQNCGIQILVEYKGDGESGGKQSKRVDWRATLARPHGFQSAPSFSICTVQNM